MARVAVAYGLGSDSLLPRFPRPRRHLRRTRARGHGWRACTSAWDGVPRWRSWPGRPGRGRHRQGRGRRWPGARATPAVPGRRPGAGQRRAAIGRRGPAQPGRREATRFTRCGWTCARQKTEVYVAKSHRRRRHLDRTEPSTGRRAARSASAACPRSRPTPTGGVAVMFRNWTRRRPRHVRPRVARRRGHLRRSGQARLGHLAPRRLPHGRRGRGPSGAAPAEHLAAREAALRLERPRHRDTPGRGQEPRDRALATGAVEAWEDAGGIRLHRTTTARPNLGPRSRPLARGRPDGTLALLAWERPGGGRAGNARSGPSRLLREGERGPHAGVSEGQMPWVTRVASPMKKSSRSASASTPAQCPSGSFTSDTRHSGSEGARAASPGSHPLPRARCGSGTRSARPERGELRCPCATGSADTSQRKGTRIGSPVARTRRKTSP